MAYIDTTPALSPYKVREGTLQEGFKNMLVQNGWTAVKEFMKAVTSTHFVTEHPESAMHEDSFTIAKHQIVRNARGDLLGIATVADWKALTDHTNGFPHYNWFNSNDTEKEALLDYMKKEYEVHKVETTLYLYMIEKVPDIEDGATILTPCGEKESDNDLRLQMALDVEVTVIDFKSTTASSSYIKVAHPTVMQSPIVETALRATFLEDNDYPYLDTNWWGDSEVSVKGNIDSNSFFLILQTDNTPIWEDNVIPIVPIYFGDIESMDEGDSAIALFSGTVPQGATNSEVATFDFSDHTKLGGRTIMPVLKKYPKNPSNGIDSVIINKTKLGSRYQSYYLSWNTAPNDMPPQRNSDNTGVGDGDRQYPRSFDRINSYQFNPSRYSGKVQTSRIYLVHPEEGVRGYLKNSVGLNSANLNASELRIRKEDCPEKIFDVYQCVPVSAVSPLTKRPSTHYRPMGLGLYKEELNVTNTDEVVKDPTEITDTETTVTTDFVQINFTIPDGVDNVEITVDDELVAKGVREVGFYRLFGLSKGTHTIKLVTVNSKGAKSIGTTVNVDVV